MFAEKLMKPAYKECILHIANGVTACYLKITYRNRNIGSSFPLFLFTYFYYFLLCSRRIMCMRKSSKHPHKLFMIAQFHQKNSVSRPRTISNWHNHIYIAQWDVENDERRPKIRERIPWFDSHRSRCILEPGGSFCHDDSLVPRYGTILSTHRTRAEYWRSSDKMAINIGIGWRGSESRQWMTMSVRVAGYRPSKRGRWWRYRRWYRRFWSSSHHSHIRWWDWTW